MRAAIQDLQNRHGPEAIVELIIELPRQQLAALDAWDDPPEHPRRVSLMPSSWKNSNALPRASRDKSSAPPAPDRRSGPHFDAISAWIHATPNQFGKVHTALQPTNNCGGP